MSTNTHITAAIAVQRLCIHCAHCETTYPTLCASHSVHHCTLKRDDVDGSPKYTASTARANPLVCGGRKWMLGTDVIVHAAAEEAETARREEWVQTFVPTAREHVKNRVIPTATCGGYEEARRRVEDEMKIGVS